MPDQYRINAQWRELPRDMTRFERGAASDPFHEPRPALRPSTRRRLSAIFEFARSTSFIYLTLFGFFLMPAFRFGGYRLTAYERFNRMDSLLVGERVPFMLWRARRRHERIAPEAWHPLSSLPPGASITFPLARSKSIASGKIIERCDFWEPENLRQWRLYIVETPGKAERDCLVVCPRKPGDWRRVRVRSGFIHMRFATAEAPMGWPPANHITVLGGQGWPVEYNLKACSWQRAGINPFLVELQGIVRSASDPPGRQYKPHAGAFWFYEAPLSQHHKPLRRYLEIFLLLDQALMLESDTIAPSQIEYDLKPEGQSLALVRGKH